MSCDKVVSIKIPLLSCPRYEEAIHILFSKALNVISKHSLIILLCYRKLIPWMIK